VSAGHSRSWEQLTQRQLTETGTRQGALAPCDQRIRQLQGKPMGFFAHHSIFSKVSAPSNSGAIHRATLRYRYVSLRSQTASKTAGVAYGVDRVQVYSWLSDKWKVSKTCSYSNDTGESTRIYICSVYPEPLS
jgi:hypothetical protein